MGTKFEIGRSHDEVLEEGALPMDRLKERIEDWVATQKAGAAAAR